MTMGMRAVGEASLVAMSGKLRAKRRLLLLCLSVACAIPSQGAMAQSGATPAGTSVLDAFRDICIKSKTQTEAVLTAARAAGFSPMAVLQPSLQRMKSVLTLERGTGAQTLYISLNTGFARINSSLEAEVPTRICAIRGAALDEDFRGFARSLVGVPPLLDADGVVAYIYRERANGNLVAPEDNLPALIDGANAGELRSLVARDIGNLHGLAWIVFEIPALPLLSPAALTAAHESDPFAPCRWETTEKPKNIQPFFSCPDRVGIFRREFVKGVTAETPAQARSGDVAAMTTLANFYATGPGHVRDPASAFAWFKRSAEAGAPGGAFNLGLAYDDGVGVAADKAQAERWYRRASEQQQVSAMVNLAALLLNKANGTNAALISEATALIRKASGAGSPDATFNLGYLAEKGIGQPKDMTEAVRLYRLGSNGKDTRTMSRLGLIYADGLGGIARDEAEAARWFVKAVRPTLRLFSTLLGMEAIIYRFEDPKLREAFSRAATNDPSLALKLGLFLADRKKSDRDRVEAIRLLKIAADAKMPIAALRLGVMYTEGDGVPANNSEAIKWFRTDSDLSKIDMFQRVTNFTDKAVP